VSEYTTEWCCNFSPHLFSVLTLPCGTLRFKNHEFRFKLPISQCYKINYETVINSKKLLCFIRYFTYFSWNFWLRKNMSKFDVNSVGRSVKVLKQWVVNVCNAVCSRTSLMYVPTNGQTDWQPLDWQHFQHLLARDVIYTSSPNLWPFDLRVTACRGPDSDYICIDFSASSSSRFPFRPWTNRQTELNIVPCTPRRG